MTSDSNIYSGHIASAFLHVLAAEELQAATKKAPAKKVPEKPSAPKGTVCKSINCPKKKASDSPSEALRGWTLPSQPQV